MAILPILCYPDQRLHTVARPVQAVDERVRALTADLLATMYDAHGIGLAATQVNVHERVVVLDVSEERDQPLVLINPEIVWASDEKLVGDYMGFSKWKVKEHLNPKVFKALDEDVLKEYAEVFKITIEELTNVK